MNTKSSTCRLTGGPVDPIFKATVLGKYEVQYYRCRDTGFIQTETPFWLTEAYSSAISALDVGCVARNIQLASITSQIIEAQFVSGECFLDYGGGTGMFVRMMRDAGFKFLRFDPYCENVFARGFDKDDSALFNRSKCALLTAFEVFEHLENPRGDIGRMFDLCDTILFSTELQPERELASADSWWYFVPEAGQHIAFYNLRSLEHLACHYGATLYSDNRWLHMLTRNPSVFNPFRASLTTRLRSLRVVRRAVSILQRIHAKLRPEKRESLMNRDFEFIRKGLCRSAETGCCETQKSNDQVTFKSA